MFIQRMCRTKCARCQVVMSHATEPFVVFGCRTEGDWFHQVVENHQSHGALAWILQMRTCK